MAALYFLSYILVSIVAFFLFIEKQVYLYINRNIQTTSMVHGILHRGDVRKHTTYGTVLQKKGL